MSPLNREPKCNLISTKKIKKHPAVSLNTKELCVKLSTTVWHMANHGSQYFNYLVKMSVSPTIGYKNIMF